MEWKEGVPCLCVQHVKYRKMNGMGVFREVLEEEGGVAV